MTVQQLIEKLKLFNPHAEVVIEEGNRECYPVREENIEEDMVTDDYNRASMDDMDVEVCVAKVIIRT